MLADFAGAILAEHDLHESFSGARSEARFTVWGLKRNGTSFIELTARRKKRSFSRVRPAITLPSGKKTNELNEIRQSVRGFYLETNNDVTYGMVP